MANRAAQHAAQHVPPFVVRRNDPVGHEEAQRPRVVGDHPHRGVGLGSRAVGGPRATSDRMQDRQEEIGVVVAALALEDRRDSLEPHPRIDRRGGKRHEGAVGLLIELHEHQVPDLDVAPRVVFGRRNAVDRGQVGAEIEVDFAARTAGARIPHSPEVFLFAQAQDPARIDTDRVAPDRRGLLVARHGGRAVEDGDPQALFRYAVHLGEQLPRPDDRVFLEVVAEREVPEHLEERVMARRAADLFEVVVLSGDTQAFLGRRGPRILPLLASGEDVFELVHPGVREQQRRVVGQDERRARHDTVAARCEEIEKRAAGLERGHGSFLLKP